jgi:hypothetical protein
MTVDAILRGRPDVLVDALRHLMLPTIALAAASIGQITRITRSSMIDVSRKDYVEAERAFGLPGWLVTFKYMLRPSSIPTITILGLEFASLLGNAFLVEMVFSLPGMASYGVGYLAERLQRGHGHGAGDRALLRSGELARRCAPGRHRSEDSPPGSSRMTLGSPCVDHGQQSVPT